MANSQLTRAREDQRLIRTHIIVSKIEDPKNYGFETMSQPPATHSSSTELVSAAIN